MSLRDIFLQKLLPRIILDTPPAPYMPPLGDNDAEAPVLAEEALVWLPRLLAELDCEAWPAKGSRLDREVEHLDKTRPRLEAERIMPPLPLDLMGTPVAASRRRR